jgi:hypothetical protein
LQTDSSLFFIGIAIGLGIAVVGGLIDYWLGRRDQTVGHERLVPGCMVYLAGLLGLVGIIALLVSLLVSGSLGPAFVLGAGVLGGFYAGFALLLLLYLLVKRFGPDAWR